MSRTDPARVACIAALAGSPAGLSPAELLAQLRPTGLPPDATLAACEALIERGEIAARGGALHLTGAGAHALLELHAAIERALDPSPTTAGMHECPSIPWLTTVQTCWVDALSLNYAVDPDALGPLIPAPLEPELHKGTAWVQVLISRLREMRPQGTLPLFGVSFHQVSYRAAVHYRGGDGALRRGGYFVRSDTDNAVMRAVGNALNEFKFHAFGLADVRLARGGGRLRAVVAPGASFPGGNIDATVDTRRAAPPATSVWRSEAELQGPLVECYDAFGVDAAARHVYVLTIDRQPWNAHFVTPLAVRTEFVETGALGGAARLDSVLHIPRDCAYRWRPLRRERW
jgi:uncharacterized protein YqjF (DUF2071 family)